MNEKELQSFFVNTLGWTPVNLERISSSAVKIAQCEDVLAVFYLSEELTDARKRYLLYGKLSQEANVPNILMIFHNPNRPALVWRWKNVERISPIPDGDRSVGGNHWLRYLVRANIGTPPRRKLVEVLNLTFSKRTTYFQQTCAELRQDLMMVKRRVMHLRRLLQNDPYVGSEDKRAGIEKTLAKLESLAFETSTWADMVAYRYKGAALAANHHRQARNTLTPHRSRQASWRANDNYIRQSDG